MARQMAGGGEGRREGKKAGREGRRKGEKEGKVLPFSKTLI